LPWDSLIGGRGLLDKAVDCVDCGFFVVCLPFGLSIKSERLPEFQEGTLMNNKKNLLDKL
jgi:hypothetical protein